MSPVMGRLVHTTLLAVCLPIAVLGAVLPVNEYASLDGILAGAVDCDGPMTVFMFGLPALAFYGGNAAGLLWVRERTPRWHVGMALLCLLVSIAVLPNLVRAIVASEQNKSEPACT